MRIKIIDQGFAKEFIVQVTYVPTEPKFRHWVDKYGRDNYTVWKERRTVVKVHEWKESGTSRTEWHGTTVCKYTDVPKNKVGRKIAWGYALKEMYNAGVISVNAVELARTFELAGTIVEIDVDQNEIRVLA